MTHKIKENCIGCSACATMCPVFAITGNKGEKYNVNEKRCVNCGVCGRVCPKMAIEDSEGRVCQPVNKKKWPKPIVDTKNCSACAICVTACTKEALGISMPTFKGDLRVFAKLDKPQKCVSCGLCQEECPLGAIKMEVENEPS